MFLYKVDGQFKHTFLSLENLMRAWANGLRVRIPHSNLANSFEGLITSIRLESGYSEGQRPSHFLIGLDTGKEIYVRMNAGGA